MDIPHVAKIGKFPAMINIARRKPTCLKCGDPSHLFKDCLEKGKKNKTTFAEVLQEKRPIEKHHEENAALLVNELRLILNENVCETECTNQEALPKFSEETLCPIVQELFSDNSEATGENKN